MESITLVKNIEIPLGKYELLIRDSEKLNAIRKLLEKTNYVSTNDLKVILDIEKNEEGSVTDQSCTEPTNNT